ncbi:MAG TPA: NfeD family protein [Pyrinomonadaceae bacterium]|nr:NfeD family protein [Pyrinomonadaceae bacterium]
MYDVLHALEGFSSSSFNVPPSTLVSFHTLAPPPLSFTVLLVLLVGAALIAACALVAAMSRHQKSARRPLRLEGRVGVVLEALAPEGAVLVDGELWRARARSGESIARGRVRIVGARGHWLEVEAAA